MNSLVVVDDALHVCAFGHFERHKRWKVDGQDGVGFVRDLRAGRDVLTGLSHPHTPRWRDGRWYVCESTKGSLTELDADGTVRRRAAVRRFTRGLTFVGPYALVGGNAHRERDEDRGEVAVVDLRTFEVVERIAMPCLEVYEIVVVGPGVRRGAAAGFGANAARAMEQHRAGARPADRQPAPPEAAVRLVTPQAAERLAAMGQAIDADEARRCGLRGALPAAVVAGEVTSWRLELVNRTSALLGTVPPRSLKVGVRWFRLPDGEDEPAADDTPVAVGPQTPIARVVPPGMRTDVDVMVEVPDEPGRYQVRVALRQPGVGWFGVRVQGEVTVKPDD